MSRSFGWMLLALATTGCGRDAVSFEHTGELQARTSGFAMYTRGDSAIAGMIGATCEIDAETGGIGADWDAAQGEDDVVVDAGDETGLIIGGSGVFVLDPELGILPGPAGRGFTDARLLEDDGIVALQATGSSCVVRHDVAGNETATTVTDAACPAGFDADPSTGTAWVGGPDAVFVVGADGTVTEQDGGDLLAWDATEQVLYAAIAGETWVRATEADGAVRWTVELDGAVTALTDMGAVGAVAVTVERGDGTGAIVILDGATGAVSSEVDSPSAADDLTASSGGDRLAVILRNEVHLFAVRVDPR